jgi:hypothetical protein
MNLLVLKYIHTTNSLLLCYKVKNKSFEMPTFYQNDLAMRNSADVTGGKPIAV